MTMVLRTCRDCDRRAEPDSPYCASCIDRICREAFATPTLPEWLRRGMTGENRGKDLTGASL